MDTALGIRIVLEFTRFPSIWIFPSHKVILKECISVLQSSLSDPNIVFPFFCQRMTMYIWSRQTTEEQSFKLIWASYSKLITSVISGQKYLGQIMVNKYIMVKISGPDKRILKNRP